MARHYVHSCGTAANKYPGRVDVRFDSNPSQAFQWLSKEEAEIECSQMNGRSVKLQPSESKTALLSLFKVEETLPGKFSIYCDFIEQ